MFSENEAAHRRHHLLLLPLSSGRKCSYVSIHDKSLRKKSNNYNFTRRAIPHILCFFSAPLSRSIICVYWYDVNEIMRLPQLWAFFLIYIINKRGNCGAASWRKLWRQEVFRLQCNICFAIVRDIIKSTFIAD